MWSRKPSLFCQRLPKDLPLPLHLGVTEAGDSTAGRSKSIVGIAPLLLDGLGDTIGNFRVSLAEDSANEILFAKKFLKYFEKYKANQQSKLQGSSQLKFDQSKFYQAKLESYRVQNTPFTFQTKKLYLGDARCKIGFTETFLSQNAFF